MKRKFSKILFGSTYVKLSELKEKDSKIFAGLKLFAMLITIFGCTFYLHGHFPKGVKQNDISVVIQKNGGASTKDISLCTHMVASDSV